MKTLAALALLFSLAGPALAQPYGPTPIAPPRVPVTQLSLPNYIYPADTDATAGFGRAVTAALALNTPVEILIPCGTYVLSASIAITTTGAQSISLKGDASACVIIQQSADADGIVGVIQNYGIAFLGGTINVSGITFQKTGGASSARTALSITTTAVGARTSAPLVIDDIAFSSPSATIRWATGLSVSNISNVAYISRISGWWFNGATDVGVGISVFGTSSTYSSSIFLRDISIVSGNIGVKLGDYLQGIHVANLNTINSLYSVDMEPVAGIGVEIQITDSYLDGKMVFSPTSPAVLNGVKITNSYINHDAIVAGETQVLIKNVPNVQIHGNLFNGPFNAVANVVGLTIDGTTDYNTSITSNIFQAYASGGTAIVYTATTSGISAIGNMFINNSTNVTDGGTSNYLINSNVNGTFYGNGVPSAVPTVAYRFLGPVLVPTLTVSSLLTASAGANITGTTNVLGADNSIALAGKATGVNPTITAFGTDTDISISLVPKGAGAVTTNALLLANGGINTAVINSTLAAGNGVAITPKAAGLTPSIAAFGADTNVSLSLVGKGTGSVIASSLLTASAGANVTGALNVSTAAGNGVAASGAAAGGSAKLTAFGVDTDVVLQLAPKGAGVIFSNGVHTLRNYTVATLPTASAALKGGIAYVTDATAPTYRGVLIGGGAVITMVFCDGTAWTSQ